MEETVEEAHRLKFCDKSDEAIFFIKSIVQGYLEDSEFLKYSYYLIIVH